jgi:hypothetical protein
MRTLLKTIVAGIAPAFMIADALKADISTLDGRPLDSPTSQPSTQPSPQPDPTPPPQAPIAGLRG